MFTTAEESYAGATMLASSTLVQDDCTWVLYFYTWEKSAYPSTGGIGRATAKAPSGPWAADMQRSADGYGMYYSGVDSKGIQMISIARSHNGITWTKDNDPTSAAPFAASDPVLRPGQQGTWSAAFVHQPRVAQTPTGRVMLYRGVPDQHSNVDCIGCRPKASHSMQR